MWHWERSLTTASNTSNTYVLYTTVANLSLPILGSELDPASLHHFKVRLLAYGHPGLFSNWVTIERPETGQSRNSLILYFSNFQYAHHSL